MIFQLSMRKNIHSDSISPWPLLNIIVSLEEAGFLEEWFPREKEKRRLSQRVQVEDSLQIHEKTIKQKTLFFSPTNEGYFKKSSVKK